MSALSGFTVLVGRNGSGKTFLFDALERFFSEFQMTAGSSSWSSTDYYWHRRDTSRPIGIEATIELSEAEKNRLIAAAQGLTEEIKPAEEERGYLRVSRQLGFGQGWKTTHLTWGTLELVNEDKPVSELVVSRPDLLPEN